MNSVDLIKKICKERGIPISHLERDLGYGNGYIGQLRKGTIPSDRAIEIADYLSVELGYLLSGGTTSTNSYEIFAKLLEERNLKAADVAAVTGITKSTFSDWKNGRSKPKNEKLQKIADYFGVTVDYLMTGEETEPKEPVITPRDARDIAKDLNNIMEKLTSGIAGPASFNGEEITPEAAELFKEELDIALRRLKLINKEKYTPKKYKK